jgi:tetratricopeptide (TPR) repeat protein
MLGIMAGAINAPRLRDGSGARREFVAPGERQRKIALALCVLSILCFIKTSHYGVNYFRAAIVNNNGLNLTGETGGADTVAGHQGVLQLVRESAQYGRLPLSARGEHIAQLESALRSMNLTNDNNRLIYSILDIMRQPATLDKANLDLLQSEIKRVEANYEQLRLGAIKAFEDAIRLNPYFTTSYYKLATLYFYGPRLNPGREDYLAALEMYRRLQKMGPEYSQVRLNLGATFLNLGDFERAVRQYRLAARMSVDVLEMNPTRLFIINLQRVAAQRKSPLLSVYDIENAAELARRLMKPRSPLEKRLAESLGEETKNGLKIIVGSGATNIIDYEDNLNEEKMGKSPKRQEELKERFLAVRGALEKMVEDLNKALNGPELYDAEAFRKITLSPSTLERHKVQERMKREPGNTHLVRLNRMLLCDAFSGDLALPPAEEAARVAWRQVEWWERIYSDDKPIRWTEKTRESEVRETAARMWYQAARAGASYPEQVRAFRHLWSLTSQPESLLPMLFELCVEYQDPASLASFCSELLKTEPSNASLHLYLALAEVEMGRPREAKRHALIVKNLEPGGVEHRYVLHLVYKKAGMAEQAKLEAEEYAKAGRNALWVNEARLHTQGIDMRGANPDNVVIVDDATTVPRP